MNGVGKIFFDRNVITINDKTMQIFFIFYHQLYKSKKGQSFD